MLWVFLAVSLAGLVFLSDAVLRAVPTPPQAVAPTDEEYRAEASVIMEPFLAQASAMTAEDFELAEPEALRTLVVTTQERMLRLRVPSDLKDAHLAFVLMLERWHRAFDGDADMRVTAISQLRAEVDAYPWVRGENQNL